LSYEEARTKFRKAAQAIQGAELHILPILSTTSGTTTSQEENDEDTATSYTMDIAILPGTHSGMIVHLCGTHGIEGYAGSAIQLTILSLYLQQQLQAKSQQEDDMELLVPQQLQRPAVVLIHAVNPYGMKHYRRPNENNVDLNRQAIRYPQDVQRIRESSATLLDAAIRAELRMGGMKSGSSISSRGEDEGMTIAPPNYCDGTIGYWMHLGYLLYKYDFLALKRALVTGQYDDPRGILFQLDSFWYKNLEQFLVFSSHGL
jgi:hypothetical protein